MLPGMKRLSRSPGGGSPSKSNWRSPVASPLSSAHQTPTSYHLTPPRIHSPISPYNQSPFVRPTLYSSPGNLNSPVCLAHQATLMQVSRSYPPPMLIIEKPKSQETLVSCSLEALKRHSCDGGCLLTIL
ncbi:hypothetical protein M9H77_26626 [Catharanthus roseus]|uniref:Uncharacterized protein n=1 Tax=Catharanthus roseus TaxID=4058 RepID=A0ACC0AEG5_CATRO|nr:hypothetical protein M9H77_26626 [Catharanthus roseus]